MSKSETARNLDKIPIHQWRKIRRNNAYMFVFSSLYNVADFLDESILPNIWGDNVISTLVTCVSILGLIGAVNYIGKNS